MPTTQTVVEASPQSFSAEYLQNMSMVDQYKNVLTQIRLQRAALASQMQSLMDDISNMRSSRQSLLDQFHIKAFQMYPQYTGQDLKGIIKSLNGDHPLVQLWLTYSQTINDVRNAIVSKGMALQDLMNQELALEDQESQTLSSYEDFASSANTAVPSSDQLVSDLVQVSVIPVETETSVIASIPAIETLDPEAAAAVTLQVAQNADQTPVDLSVSTQDTGAIAAPTGLQALKNLHPAILYGGGAVILMMIFGGKK